MKTKQLIPQVSRNLHRYCRSHAVSMKKIKSLSLGAVIILGSIPTLRAGALTVGLGPVLSPDSAFTNTDIQVDSSVQNPLVHLSGTTTITPDETGLATIEVFGTYANGDGDRFSTAYSFTADLNANAPVPYTIVGRLTFLNFVQLAVSASGTLLPGLHKYEGTDAIDPFTTGSTGDFDGTLTFDFTGTMAGPSGAAPGTVDLNFHQIDFLLDPERAGVDGPSQPQNISTRANVGVGDNVLIGGIIIAGLDTKQVVLRAIGPSLAAAGVSGVLADPTLELYDSTGALIDSNDDWIDLSAFEQAVLTGFGLDPDDSKESALVADLDPGAYTAIVRGANNTTGIALVEGYDLDNGTTDSGLANISTRGFVATGDDVVIGGFILGGGEGGFDDVIVRGIGPSLADVGVSDVLLDPFIEIFDSQGNSLATNDDWMDDANMQSVSDRELAPSNDSEAALFQILPIGAYTVILSGAGNTTGNALVEAYNVYIPPL